MSKKVSYISRVESENEQLREQLQFALGEVDRMKIKYEPNIDTNDQSELRKNMKEHWWANLSWFDKFTMVLLNIFISTWYWEKIGWVDTGISITPMKKWESLCMFMILPIMAAWTFIWAPIVIILTLPIALVCSVFSKSNSNY